jgi:hypothetical protein
MRVSRTCPSCGYTADYASAPLADAHHPRHSCANYRRGRDQAARRAERLQARVPRECTHPQARHRHGTRTAYVKDRCRRTDCTADSTGRRNTAAWSSESSLARTSAGVLKPRVLQGRPLSWAATASRWSAG